MLEAQVAKAGVQSAWAIAKIVLIVVFIGAVVFFANDYRKARQTIKIQNATIEGQTTKAESTAEITDDLGAATDKQTHTETIIRDVQIVYRDRYQELKNADQSVAAFDSTPVPLSLRKLACEGRIARDGPADNEAGCGRFDQASEPAR